MWNSFHCYSSCWVHWKRMYARKFLWWRWERSKFLSRQQNNLRYQLSQSLRLIWRCQCHDCIDLISSAWSVWFFSLSNLRQRCILTWLILLICRRSYENLLVETLQFDWCLKNSLSIQTLSQSSHQISFTINVKASIAFVIIINFTLIKSLLWDVTDHNLSLV